MPWWGTSKTPWTRRRCRPPRCSSWGECCCATRCWRRRCTSASSHGRPKSAGAAGGGKHLAIRGFSRNFYMFYEILWTSMRFYHVSAHKRITQLVLRNGVRTEVVDGGSKWRTSIKRGKPYCMYISTYIHFHIYIYIHIHTGRQTDIHVYCCWMAEQS